MKKLLSLFFKKSWPKKIFAFPGFGIQVKENLRRNSVFSTRMAGARTKTHFTPTEILAAIIISHFLQLNFFLNKTFYKESFQQNDCFED